ncbi:DNA-binding protein [Mycobacterium sp. Y57]|nr:DNA-binding protein [Mycolicibacterium xanthum]
MAKTAWSSADLAAVTGIPASTWRYFAMLDKGKADDAECVGPRSFKVGRRRLWRRETALQWLADQEAGGRGAETATD